MEVNLELVKELMIFEKIKQMTNQRKSDDDVKENYLKLNEEQAQKYKN